MGVVIGGAFFRLKSIRRKSTNVVGNKIEDTSFDCYSLFRPLNLDTIYVSFTTKGSLRVRNIFTSLDGRAMCVYNSINRVYLGYKPPSPITYGPLSPLKHKVLYTKNTYPLLLRDRSSVRQDRPWHRF